MATKPSILTTLSDEKIAAQHRTMSRESLTWLMKRIQGLRNPYGMVRPLTKETHRYVRASDRQKFLMGGLYYFWYDPKTKKELTKKLRADQTFEDDFWKTIYDKTDFKEYVKGRFSMGQKDMLMAREESRPEEESD